MAARTTRLGLLVVMLLAWPMYSASAQANGARTAEERAADGIAVSLREIGEATEAVDPASLFGATRLLGFLLAEDERGPDCILVFEVEPDRPELRIDDLAVAHANVVSGEARPACTIDPRPRILRRLANLAERISSQGERAIQRNLREWERIGKGPQDVRVFNIDEETHFASVMVQADYEMKALCNGETPAAGITSLTDLSAQQAEREIAASGAASTSPISQNRFWFNPGRVTYQSDGRLFLLGECEVTLLTEEEAITHEGERSGTSQPNPTAQAFADDLTARFSDLAAAEPVYRELENLYRAVAVMSLLHTEAERVQGLVNDAFARVTVPQVPFHKTLPGRVSVKEIHGSVAGGTYVLWLPTCGGVSIEIDAGSIARDEVGPARLSAVVRRITAARLNARQLFWRVPL